MKKINILKISVLLTLLIILMFSCKQYGVKQFTEEINDSPGAKNSNVSKNKNSENSQTVKAVIAKSWPSLTPEEASKLKTATSFLGEAITANGREEEKAEYEKSYREFFEWLSKDINKQKEFLQALDKVYGIIVKAVEKDKETYRDGGELGLNEYISHRIKNHKGGHLSLFFQKVADAFGIDDYYRKKGKNSEANNKKPEKSNEEIFKVIKKLFTESDDNRELKNLKDYADGNIG